VMDSGERSEVPLAKAVREFIGKFGSGDRNEFGMVADDLREEDVQIIAGGEDRDAEFVGQGFDDRKRLASDGAGAAEDGEDLHAHRKV